MNHCYGLYSYLKDLFNAISCKPRQKIIFQEDNALVHTTKKIIKWKLDNSIVCLPWPSQSLDFNLIKHLWDEPEYRVYGCSHLMKTKLIFY